MSEPTSPPDGPTPDRPTPARLGAGPPRSVREGVPAPEPEPETPSRTFRSPDGTLWHVEVAGRALTGRRGEPRADLLLLVFRLAVESEGDSAQGPAGGAAGAWEALAATSALDDLTDEALESLRAAARPFRADAGAKDLFPATRRRSGRD